MASKRIPECMTHSWGLRHPLPVAGTLLSAGSPHDHQSPEGSTLFRPPEKRSRMWTIWAVFLGRDPGARTLRLGISYLFFALTEKNSRHCTSTEVDREAATMATALLPPPRSEVKPTP